MQLGMIGLGRMGGNMVRRLMRNGHDCVVFDLDPSNVSTLAKEGASGAGTLDAFVQALTPPRAAWVMVPAGQPTEQTVEALASRMQPGDIIIDGGNSYYKDDVRRATALKAKGLHYVDVGTSGGVWGLERGYCLMIGASQEAMRQLEPIFKTLAPGPSGVPSSPGRENRTSSAENGYLHCGPPGAGHFVKMIHNGIEYGMMQAFAEGFDILRNVNSPAVPENRRSTMLGVVAATSSLGTLLIAPSLQALLAQADWHVGMLFFLGLAAFLVPAAYAAGGADRLPRQRTAASGATIGRAGLGGGGA